MKINEKCEDRGTVLLSSSRQQEPSPLSSPGSARDGRFRLAESRSLSATVRLLRLTGDTSAISAPGQFVSVAVPGKFLRRPFSVCDWDEGWLTLLIERVGAGTELLQALEPGAELEILTGLGNGFTIRPESRTPVLVGCGSGLSPMAGLARRLTSRGVRPSVLLGFREEGSRFGAELFPGLDVQYTEDLFAALDRTDHDYFYACGSEAVMTELCRWEKTGGQVAFDVRMGCGFGACMGCAKKTRDGMKRVCKDGPVFGKEDLVWED